MDLKVDDDVLRKEFEQLIAQEPGYWNFPAQYVDFLEDRKHYSKARAVVQPEEDFHWQELLDYYRQNKDPYYYASGNYLLGLFPQDELLKLATDRGKRCELAYYIGRRAEVAGKYEEACRWFGVCVETGVRNYVEWNWAINSLDQRARRWKSLKLLTPGDLQSEL